MTDAEREALTKAYQATRYVIRPAAFTGGREWVLRVGALHPELDTALTAAGHREWAFLTAWNPGSRQQSRDENDRAQRQLESELLTGGWRVLDAIGIADAPHAGDTRHWSEDSLFVLGLPREEAERLGRAHGQVAVLVGRVDGPAELLFCEDSRTRR